MKLSRLIEITLIASAIGVSHCAIAEDTDDLYGYIITPSVNVLLKLDGKKVCLPAKSRLMVLSVNNSGEYIVKITGGEDITACTTVPNGEPKVFKDVSYTLEKNTYKESGFAIRGMTAGLLAIPFKYQLSGNKEFTGGGTLGGYMGYRWDFLNNLGVTATPVMFAGSSNISITDKTSGNTKNSMGISYGVGLIGTLRGDAQAGLVLGWDRVGSNEGYAYNGKPWVAFQIGFSFFK